MAFAWGGYLMNNNQELRDRLTSYHALPKIKVDGVYIVAPPIIEPPKPLVADKPSINWHCPEKQGVIIFPNGKSAWGYPQAR